MAQNAVIRMILGGRGIGCGTLNTEGNVSGHRKLYKGRAHSDNDHEIPKAQGSLGLICGVVTEA